MESDAISEETIFTPYDYEPSHETEYKKKEILEGNGKINRISREEKNDKVYYKLTIGNTYYTKFINNEKTDKYMASFSKDDEVKFTWTGKAVGGREFRNIQRIEKIKGNTSIMNYETKYNSKTPEELAELRKRKINSITFGQALNNATILFASIANTQENPKKWIEENIGSPFWKAIEQKLYENYIEQRNEIIGE